MFASIPSGVRCCGLKIRCRESTLATAPTLCAPVTYGHYALLLTDKTANAEPSPVPHMQPPLSVPRDNLDVSRGYFLRYANLRGFTTGKKTAVHDGCRSRGLTAWRSLA